MYRLKKPDLPEPTLQASARATESTFQASARSLFKYKRGSNDKIPW
jgi:hypothetical protein